MASGQNNSSRELLDERTNDETDWSGLVVAVVVALASMAQLRLVMLAMISCDWPKCDALHLSKVCPFPCPHLFDAVLLLLLLLLVSVISHARLSLSNKIGPLKGTHDKHDK